jgi:drug/metabolite transporter (DMT)-like permease
VPLALVLAAAFLAANLALQAGAARLRANVTAVVMLSEIVFASVSAALLGDQQFTAALWIGGGLILGAALLAALEEHQ